MGEIRYGGCGAPWALVGLHLLSRPTATFVSIRDEAVLLGAAHLLGLLVERAQRRGNSLEEKVRRAENELRQIKLVRADDAKANEKVVAIYASHEQSWITQRKMLRIQIRALAAQLQSLTAKNEDTVSNLSCRVNEVECEIRAKDEALNAERNKRDELEEKLQSVEKEVEELRQEIKKEEDDYVNELQKHKAAFAELVSNHDQLEAEMARALDQAEAAKRELEKMLEMKEEALLMVEKLSDKIGKMQNDAEQKDKIFSALLRKSKFDAAEKQMLVKEVKISKAKKKQAELEMEKWKNKWDLRHKKGQRPSNSDEVAGCSQERREYQMPANRGGLSSKSLFLDYFESEWGKEHEFSETTGENVIAAIKCLEQYSAEEFRDELVNHDIQNLQDWVRLETQKYAAILEQKHFAEIDAFTEQMRLKDEKLEAFRWRLLSRDIESKRVQSQIEELEENMSQLWEENVKLEALLLTREGEIKYLKDQFGFLVHHSQRNSLIRSTASSICEAQAEMNSAIEEQNEIEHDAEACLARNSCGTENNMLEEATAITNGDTAPDYKDRMANDITEVNSTDSAPSTDCSADNYIICVNEVSSNDAKSIDSYGEQVNIITSVTRSPKREIEEEKEAVINPAHAPLMKNSSKGANAVGKVAPAAQSITWKESSGKMDFHALGVSYKIKRLKQQVIVLEKLAGMKQIMISDGVYDNGPKEKNANDNKKHLKGIMLVIHLLNKQVKRFQSLEEKTDDLCRRMHENSRGGDRRDSRNGKEHRRVLESFLEETFQLQRYMVATGQKLMEIQSKITGSITSYGLDESVGFNLEQFAAVIRTLFREIQRGLEVRIARIMGDIEGTLACAGIQHI